MLETIIFALWFFAPAGVANVTPILVAKAPGLCRWNVPIDFGLTFRKKRIFGAHKTWRGLITGIVMATVTLALQQYLAANFGWAQWVTQSVDYAALPLLIVGPLFGFGALAGDAIESFFKRQRNIKPGEGWFPFDQIDYIIGGAIATMPFVQLSVVTYLWLIALWLVIHVIASYIGYLSGLKEKPI